jgi:hypothetical protein
MARKYRDPEAPEVLEAVLQEIRGMTREEWQEELAWRPEGVRETWRTQRTQGSTFPHRPGIAPRKGAAGRPSKPDTAAIASSHKLTKR